MGNPYTCSIARFFFVLGPFLITFYTFYLTLFFYIKIKYPNYYNKITNQNLEQMIITKYQWPFHAVAILVSFAIPTIGIMFHGFKLVDH